MQVKTIRYSRLISTRQYENESYEMVADISFNEDPEAEMLALKGMVDNAIQRNEDNFSASISNAPVDFTPAKNEPLDYGEPAEERVPVKELEHEEDFDEFTMTALGKDAMENEEVIEWLKTIKD